MISYANLDGSGAGDLHITGVPVNHPGGIALDPAADRIYWANSPGSKISYAKLDGSGGHDLPITGVPVMVPSGIALDPAAGKIYWANAFGATISYANLDGSGAGNIAPGQATVHLPQGVAVDPGAGRIYWANALGGANGTDGTTSIANLDGSGGRDLSPAFATFGQPTGVALDPATNRLYWANSASAVAISFANLNSFGGGDLKTVGAPADSPEGVAIDSAAGRIYWADNGDPGVNQRRDLRCEPGRLGRRSLQDGRGHRQQPELPRAAGDPARRRRSDGHGRLERRDSLVLAGRVGSRPGRLIPVPRAAHVLLPVESRRGRHPRRDRQHLRAGRGRRISLPCDRIQRGRQRRPDQRPARSEPPAR